MQINRSCEGHYWIDFFREWNGNKPGRIAMNYSQITIGLLLVAGILAAPAAALTATSLAMNIKENGDAEISVDYSLSWVERVVVFMKIAHPEQQLEQALEGYTGKEVQVTSVNPGRTDLFVQDFAGMTDNGTGITYRTPSMDFIQAEQMIQGYWFSRFVRVDASPEIAVITFPDGYEETFLNVANIPGVIHKTGN